MNEQNDSGNGSVVGIVIVILILVIGGIYFFNQRIQKQNQMNATSSDTVSAQEYANLQSDASSMNFDNLGTGTDQLQ
jgi:uncharacterized protein HemX